jgi:hypothetical protein
MEPKMISLKVLSTAAAIALVVPMVMPSASFAQGLGLKAAGRPVGGGGAPAPHVGGGGVHVGGGAPGPRFSGGGAPGPRFSGGGGGVYRGGGYGGGGGYYRHGGGGGGFIPGAVAGAIVGGAIASQGYYGQGYYGGPGYYAQAPGYYDDSYAEDGVVAVAPAPAGGDDVGYCMQTYRSYDPRSGTYLGNDGFRHPCP